MSYESRRILTPGAGAARKRKEMDSLHSSTSSKPSVPSTHFSVAVSGTKEETTMASSNRLLAGYMAYEFLTMGTLFGEKFEPARDTAVRQPSTGASRPNGKSKPQSYAEVTKLLKSDESHVPGVVNPTQLARWIQM